MVVLLRVDHRLLHGQIAYSWVNYLRADCILIANDDILKDELRRTTVRMAKPSDTKLVIKGIDDSVEALKKGVTDKYRLLIVVESVEDAVRLVREYPEIKRVNLGNVKAREGTKQVGRTFNVTAQEEQDLKMLVEQGVSVEIQSVPEEKNVPFTKAV